MRPKTNTLVFFLALITWICFESGDFAFFWDTVQLGSKHAHWFYENRFSSLLLPSELDSGHPPFFGMYLAVAWIFFGKSLLVSHFAMLPFLWGIIWMLNRLGTLLEFKPHVGYLLPILFFLDAVSMGQALLVSPDIPLLFFFLCAAYGWLSPRKIWLLLGALGLSMISLRGIMTAFGFGLLVLIQQLFIYRNSIPQIIKSLAPVIPAGVFAFLFLWVHQKMTGWTGYHPDSPWAVSFQRVPISGMLKNMAILSWRIMDYGRIIELFLLVYLGWRCWKTKFLPAQAKPLLLLSAILILVLLPSMILHQHLSAHRYLLPLFFALHLLFFSLAQKGNFYGLYSLTLVGLLSGWLWVYPNHIAQGWDATPAHAPYYAARENAIGWMEKNNLHAEECGTVFPNLGPEKYVSLLETRPNFAPLNLSSNKWVFYSNVFNEVPDSSLKVLLHQWKPIYREGQWPVEIIIFKNPNGHEETILERTESN